MAGWDPGGSSDRSLGRLRIRRVAGEGIAVGCRNFRRIAAVAVAQNSCLLQDRGCCSRRSRIAVLGGHADTVDRPGRLCRGKTVRGRDLGHCCRKAAGRMVEESAGSLAEANDHILAGQEKSIGRVEELAVRTEVVVGHT